MVTWVVVTLAAVILVVVGLVVAACVVVARVVGPLVVVGKKVEVVEAGRAGLKITRWSRPR